MKCPDTRQLSREDGEALRTRLAGDALTAPIGACWTGAQWYFWLLFALQEATVGLKRLRVMLFGVKPKKRQDRPAEPSEAPRDSVGVHVERMERPPKAPRGGASRPRGMAVGGAGVWGAQPVECRHETLAAGERCPCVAGALVRSSPGWPCGLTVTRCCRRCTLCAGEVTLFGLWSSVHGTVPAEAEADKYSARARAVLVLGRYYLGVPLYRLEGIKRWWACRCRMPPNGIRSSAWRIARIPCLNSSRRWRRRAM